MKKIFLLFIMLMSISAFSQQKDQQRKKDQAHLTLQEKAILNSKKLALKLDLSDFQRIEVEKLFTARADKKKESMAKLKKDQKNRDQFSIKNKRLDNRIAYQQKMKDILTDEQYEKWKSILDDTSIKRNKLKKKNL